ncbi:16S rRNA (guanine(966)-N(2))-methyltransferase RsmD [Candidatus Saccharibacteria bacterium]|nr:16S rRNA (guanine(966)-N(2))-methyltransferase RsmD [Candidatus Saccharibacteria bacterium]
MQIISGVYKNRPIESPNNVHTHPMGSREKNALFNMIAPYLPGATVLDTFAGSGALGLEALSRGAKSCVFIEKSPKVAKIIEKNISSLGENVVKNTTILIKNIENFESDFKFDIVIADPPYDKFNQIKIDYLSDFVSDSGILVISHPEKSVVNLPNFELLKSHSYAAARISVFQKK